MILKFEDHQRAGRAVIGLLDRDRLALLEAFADAGRAERGEEMLHALAVFAAQMATVACGGDSEAAAQAMRDGLMSMTAEHLEDGQR